MSSSLRSICSVLVFVMVVGMLTSDGRFVLAESSYRKPPFNGSIFGKRAPPINSLNSNSNNNNDYDNGGGKTLTAMCEIALDACQSWFPQDKK